MEIVDRFFSKYNELLKDLKFTDYESRLIKKKDVQTESTLLEYFLRTFDFQSKVGFYFFDLSGKVNLNSKRFIWIGSYPNINLEYAFDTKSGEIVMFDSQGIHLVWACSKNMETFLESMILIFDLKKSIHQNQELLENNGYLYDVYQKCMLLNGDQKRYSEFYEHITSVEL